jgi:hypothetical protein
VQKFERDPTIGSKVWPFCPLLKSGRQDLLITELRFQSNPKEKGIRKLVQNFKRDSMVGSKVMAILIVTQVWPPRPPHRRVAIP